MEYGIHLCILVCICLILAQSFNITLGLGRLLNLAHVAGYAIGAYVTAIGTTTGDLGLFTAIIASSFTSGLLSLLLGAIALRLSDDYFAIGTLAFSSIVTALLINCKSVTNGVLGISGIPRPKIAHFELLNNSSFLLLVFTITFVCLAIIYILLNGPFGRALRAQGENRSALLALGRDVRLMNTTAFFISSSFAGLAGSLYAYYMNYVDPSSFSFSEMTLLLTIVIVGSPGSFWGCIASTIFLVCIPEPLRFLDIPSYLVGPMRQLLQSVILVLVVWLNRNRLFSLIREV
jgi:branched-chain amino acid transport system permease protein